MKALGILIIIILIIYLVFIRIKTIYNNISFTFSFSSADLSGLNLSTLLGGGQSQVSINMGTTIVNKNNLLITVKDLTVILNYENTLVAQTSDTLASTPLEIQPNSSATIFYNVDVFVNPSSLKLLSQILGKNKPTVQYTAKMTIYGISITWNDNFIWEQ